MVVIAQSLALVIKNPFELRQAFGYGQKLVDLLLVLRDGEARGGVRQDECDLVGDGIGVDRHRGGAERLDRHERPVEPRPISAQDGAGIAAPKAEPMEADGQSADRRVDLLPGPALPNTEVLVPKGGTATPERGISRQQLRKRVLGLRNVGAQALLLPGRSDAKAYRRN